MNQASSPAAQLKPHQRQKIALRVLTKKETISGIAEEERVSRKFLYKQGHITQNVLLPLRTRNYKWTRISEVRDA